LGPGLLELRTAETGFGDTSAPKGKATA
jgi:hypothetical protein